MDGADSIEVRYRNRAYRDDGFDLFFWFEKRIKVKQDDYDRICGVHVPSVQLLLFFFSKNNY